MSFSLLYYGDKKGSNIALAAAGLSSEIVAARIGAQGKTFGSITEAMGLQGLAPKQANDTALHIRQAMEKLKLGRYASAWSLFVGENQPVNESYLTDCQKSLQMKALFEALSGDKGATYLTEWADSSTNGMVSDLQFTLPTEQQPFFADLFYADPDWQKALDTTKSKPLPYTYESGDESAVPVLVCMQRCGIYDSAGGAMAILPMAGDEVRLVVMFPKDKLTLHEFIPLALAKHDEWMKKAEWGNQRVLLPRFDISFQGSVRDILAAAGMGGMFDAQADYSAMGEGLRPSDILHKCRLIVDESGVSLPDPKAFYRQGIDDKVPTLAVNRPFLVLLEKTDTSQVLLIGAVRDPLGISN